MAIYNKWPLPEGTELGELTMIHVYDFYDRPVLFVCRNDQHDTFLCLLVTEEDTEETYFYLRMTPIMFFNLRRGTIDLYTAFAKAEYGDLYRMTCPYNPNGCEGIEYKESCALIDPEKVTDDQLPYKGEILRGSDFE